MSPRPRLELFLNKMEWYLATLAEPECSDVGLDLSRDAKDGEIFISEIYYWKALNFKIFRRLP